MRERYGGGHIDEREERKREREREREREKERERRGEERRRRTGERLETVRGNVSVWSPFLKCLLITSLRKQ